MKRIFTVLAAVLLTAIVFAQSPQKMSYQAVIRNTSDALITNTQIGMQISILQGSESGSAVYVETQTPTTNDNGLVSVEIGTGTVESGDFSAIDWTDGPFFIKTETALEAPLTTYTITGVSQLLSVPYALHAKTAESVAGGITETDPVFTTNFDFTGATTGDLLQFDGTKWVKLTPDYISDYQNLSLINENELVISNGNSVVLPEGTIWLKDANSIYYNDMNDGQARLYFHPNGNMSYNSTNDGAKFHLYEDDPSDTTKLIDAHTEGGTAIFGNSTAKSNSHGMNVGVLGNVNTESGTSGSAVRGYASGDGNTGYAVRAESSLETGINYGVSGIALSKASNSTTQIGGEFIARGDWEPANGVGTGQHYGILAQAYGGGVWNIGTWAQAAGSDATSNNYGGQFTGSSQVETSGYNYGIRAAGENSSFVNRGVVGTTNSAGQYNEGGLFNADGSGHPSLETRNCGIFGQASNNRQRNYGVLGIASATVNTDVTSLTAVYGEVWTDCSLIQNIGVDGTVNSKGKMNIGTSGWAYGEAIGDSINYGLYGYAANADTNYAVYATSLGYDGTEQVNYGIYAEAANGTIANYAGFFEGDVVITGDVEIVGNISKGGGTFKIDHPTDPENKYLVHSFVESPEMMNVYSGNITTDANGFATVKLPDYFEAANKDFRYQLTCIGTFAQAIVKEEISNNTFIVQTNEANVKVSWQVTAVRNDKYAEQNRIEPEQIKNEREKGKYLHPEVYGKTNNERIYNKQDNKEAKEIIDNKNKEHEINKEAAKLNKNEPK